MITSQFRAVPRWGSTHVRLLLSLFVATPVLHGQEVSFMKDVAPILVENCTGCHNPKKSESKYDLSTFAKLMKGGAMSEGEPCVVAGKPDESLFVELLLPDAQPRMPFKLDPLPEAQRVVLTKWIEQGAKFDGPNADQDWVAPYFRSRPISIPDSYKFPVPVISLGFTPDGKGLVASGFHELTQWSLDGQLAKRLRPLPERVHDLAYSPDGKYLALATGDPGQSGSLQLWRLDAGPEPTLEKELIQSSDSLLAVAFSPDGTKLAVGGADRAIRIFEIPTGNLYALIEDHADWVLDLAFDAKGTRLVSASRDKTAKVFDVVKKEAIVTFPGHNDTVYSVAFVNEDKNVASAGADQRVRIWEPEGEAKLVREVAGFGGPVFQILKTPDGKQLYACSQDATVRLINLADGAIVRPLSGHKDWVYSLSISADGSRVASGSWDGEIRIWNTADGALVKSFVAAPGYTPPSAAQAPGNATPTPTQAATK